MKAWLLFPPLWVAPAVLAATMALGGSTILLTLRPGTSDRTLAVVTVLFFVFAAVSTLTWGLR